LEEDDFKEDWRDPGIVECGLSVLGMYGNRDLLRPENATDVMTFKYCTNDRLSAIDSTNFEILMCRLDVFHQLVMTFCDSQQLTQKSIMEDRRILKAENEC
jgi:hypothetical protein